MCFIIFKPEFEALDWPAKELNCGESPPGGGGIRLDFHHEVSSPLPLGLFLDTNPIYWDYLA